MSIGGLTARTPSVYLASVVQYLNIHRGDLFAVEAVVLLPMFVLVLLVQKSLVHGLTPGAVNG